jgi:hypothetical protein
LCHDRAVGEIHPEQLADQHGRDRKREVLHQVRWPRLAAQGIDRLVHHLPDPVPPALSLPDGEIRIEDAADREVLVAVHAGEDAALDLPLSGIRGGEGRVGHFGAHPRIAQHLLDLVVPGDQPRLAAVPDGAAARPAVLPCLGVERRRGVGALPRRRKRRGRRFPGLSHVILPSPQGR